MSWLNRKSVLIPIDFSDLSYQALGPAKEIAEVIEYIRDNNVKALFIENTQNTATVETLSAETGVAIGGTLYPGSLSGPDGPASTYQDMLRHNAKMIVDALSSGS